MGGKIRCDPGRNFVVNQNTKVCSLHFSNEDYISGDPLHSKRHVLKHTAVPSVFPLTVVQHQRSTNTSKLAASVYQHCDMLEPVEKLGSPQCTYNDDCMDVEAPSKTVDIVSEMEGNIDEMHQQLEQA